VANALTAALQKTSKFRIKEESVVFCQQRLKQQIIAELEKFRETFYKCIKDKPTERYKR